MPRYESKKIAEIHQVKQVPTFMDKVKEFIGGCFGFIVVVLIIRGLFF